MEPEGSWPIRNCQPPVPILSQINPVHALTFHFLGTHLNIILPFKHGSSKWSLSFRFPHQNSVYISTPPHKCYMPRSPNPSRFITRTILGKECRSSRSSLCSFLHFIVTLSLLCPRYESMFTLKW